MVLLLCIVLDMLMASIRLQDMHCPYKIDTRDRTFPVPLLCVISRKVIHFIIKITIGSKYEIIVTLVRFSPYSTYYLLTKVIVQLLNS